MNAVEQLGTAHQGHPLMDWAGGHSDELSQHAEALEPYHLAQHMQKHLEPYCRAQHSAVVDALCLLVGFCSGCCATP
jgi:hypothetical protein